MMKKIIRLYIRQHMELILAVLFSCVGISGVLTMLEHNLDFLYLGILYLAVFSVCMGINFYKNIPLYHSILSEVASEMDFMVLGNNPLAKAETERMKQVRRIYLETGRKLQDENKNYKLLINKWVHQMKTPLSVLSMVSQEGKNVSNEIVSAEVDRMNYLLNQVLHLLRMENIENDFMVERCCLANIIKNAVNEQKNYFIQNEIYPKLQVSPEIYVYTDKKWFSFAIQQFLNNAVKYSDSGQNINISADVIEREAILQIEDFGSGILPEDQPRIFDFCYTGNNGRKKQAESSGLGLYISKNILDYLGHKVEVASAPNRGTSFHIHLNTNI